MKRVYLTTPLLEQDIENLKIDDEVYLSGEIYIMMYADHFNIIMGMLDRGEKPPMELKGAATYHTGTIFCRTEEGGFDLKAIGATTSSKFNSFTPDFIRKTGIRAVIGKGGMDDNVKKAMKDYGCVYLAIAGGCSAIYTDKVEKIECEYWPQKSWADNMLKIRVREYGPLFVSIDSKGNSIYNMNRITVEKNQKEVYKKLGIE